MAVLINFCFSVAVLVGGVILLIDAASSVGDALEAFLISRAMSFACTSFLILLAKFWWKRRTEKKREAREGTLFGVDLVEKHHWKVASSRDLPSSPPFACCCDEVIASKFDAANVQLQGHATINSKAKQAHANPLGHL